MNLNSDIPTLHASEFKRTKIIATLGPSTMGYDAIYDLIKAGANGLRMNFSHGTHDERIHEIEWVRKASLAYKKPVAIIQDLQGPKMRLGDFEGFINVEAGKTVAFKLNANYEHTGHIPTQIDLSKRVKRGERMYVSDGKVHFTIVSVKDDLVHARADSDGMLIKRKGIHLPDTDFAGEIITKKDREDIVFGSQHDIDYVAMSFVQTADDIRKLRHILRNLGSEARIIAKIETKKAVENIEEVIEEADAVMVARGDLAIEIGPETVPLIQRKIVGLGLKYATPTIVATQMLASMQDSNQATRAEVSDVATAVIMGADCLMLSDETAIGRYPHESVATMKRIVNITNQNSPIKAVYKNIDLDSVSDKQSAICRSIVQLAEDVHADAIVAETKSGATALQIAARRPERSIIAVTSNKRVAQQLALVYGCKSYVRPDDKYAATKLTNWLKTQKVLKKGNIVVTASGEYPGVVGATDTIKVRVLE